MEEISDIMKKEIEDGQREHNEMVYAVPVLKRVRDRIDQFLKEEKEDGNKHTCFGLFLAIQNINNEIERLGGKPE